MSDFNTANTSFNENQMDQLRQRAIRYAREECPTGSCPIESELIRCVDEFVAAHANAISTYIPVLTMNHVRKCIDAGTCNLKG